MAAVVVLGCASAQANIAASRRHPATLGGPDGARRTALEVVSESLRFECGAQGAGVGCRFEARYAVRNPTDQPEAVVAAFYGIGAQRVEVRVDGQPTGRALEVSEIAELDALMAEVEQVPSPLDWQAPGVPHGEPGRWGFELEVVAGASREVVVSGELAPGEGFRPRSRLLAPPVARHRLLGSDPAPRVYGVDYLISPIRTWASVGPISIEVRAPGAWGFQGRVADLNHPTRADWVASPEGDEVVYRMVVEADASARLALDFRLEPSSWRHGGPLLGVGLVEGRGEAGGLRWRAGWEVAGPPWLLYAVTAEADAQARQWWVVPTLKAALPEVYVVPSLSLGLGAPVWWPAEGEPRVGARLWLDAHMVAAAVALTVDLYPGLDPGAEDFLQVGVGLHTSF